MNMNRKRDFYEDVSSHFKSDLINNMDHMHISGNEPSSVILSQTKWNSEVDICGSWVCVGTRWIYGEYNMKTTW